MSLSEFLEKQFEAEVIWFHWRNMEACRSRVANFAIFGELHVNFIILLGKEKSSALQ
jgi:hypothetical protein